MAAILDLTTIAIDHRLLERAPLSLCQYHQVLPLAREGDRVSVAMVYPHNATVLAMLTELFDAQIVPVQSSATALQATFATLAPTATLDLPHILLHATEADNDSFLTRAANALAAEEATECVRLDAPEIGASAMLAAAGATRCRLVAMPMPAPSECATIVLRSTTSVLLATTDYAPLRHLLVVLRGLGADIRALAWSAALAASEAAEVTLLVLTDAERYDLHDLLDETTEPGRHLADAVNIVTARGVEPILRIRRGESIHQIVAELAARHDEMLVLSAESRGEFAAAAVEQYLASGAHLRALLVCKPNRITAASRTLQSNKRRLQRG